MSAATDPCAVCALALPDKGHYFFRGRRSERLCLLCFYWFKEIAIGVPHKA